MQESMTGVYRWIGFGICLIALSYFLHSALREIPSLPPVHWDLAAHAGFVTAIILSVLVTLMGGYAWVMLLRSCGQPASAVEGLTIFALAQLAKYIPGNVAHHAGRIALAHSKGFNLSRVIYSMILEAGWLISAAAILAAIWLLFIEQSWSLSVRGLPTVYQLTFSMALALTFPLSIGWILSRWRPGPLKKILAEAPVTLPSPVAVLGCLLVYLLCFFLMGAASEVLARAFLGATESRMFLLTGAFSVAWVAGFITPGAPAGLGVREVILLEILGPIYGDGVAAGLAFSLRAITTLADGLIFLAALVTKEKLGS